MSSFLLLRLPGGLGVRVDARGGSRPPRLCGAARAGRGEGRHAHQLPLLYTCSSRYVPYTTARVFLRARIFKQSMGARNRVGKGLSYRPARLHRLAEFNPWNRFLSSLNVYKYGLRCSAFSAGIFKQS
jgi:hypothetical protein